MRREGKGSAAGKLLPPGLAVGITFLLAWAGGNLILSEKLSQAALPPLAAAIAAVSALLAALLAARRAKNRRYLWGIAAAVSYFGILLLSNLLFFSGGYGAIAPIALAVFLGGGFGSFLGAWKRRKFA